MPQIPEFTQSQVISDSPTGVDINPEAFGSSAQAIGRLAGAAGDFAFALLQKRKDAQDQDYAYTTATKDKIDFEKYKQHLKLEMPTDYSGYTDAVNKWVQDRFEQNQKNAPSESAKELYQRQANPLFQKALIDASHDEFTNRAISFKNNLTDDIDHTSLLLQSTPSSDMAIDSLKTFNQRIDKGTGVIFDAATAKLFKDHASNSMAKGVLDGLYAKGLENKDPSFFQQGLDLLNGKVSVNRGAEITVNPLANGLEPHEKSAYLDKFARAMKQTKNTNMSELNRRIQDDLVQQLNGKPSDPTLFNDIQAAVNSQDLTPEFQIRSIDDHNAAYTTGQILDKMKITPPSQWSDIAKGWDSQMAAIVADAAAKNPNLKAAQQPGFNAASRYRYKAMVAAKGQQILEERQRDPALYVVNNMPGMSLKAQMAAGTDPKATQDYIRSQFINQTALGISESAQRITTKDEASQIALSLQGANEQQTAQQFSILEQKYGENFPRVFSEMVDDKNIDAKYWVASFVKDPYTRQRILSNVINGSQIDKAFFEKYSKEDSKSLVSDVTENADTYLSSIAQQSAGGGSLEKYNALRDVVVQEAKKLMLTSPDLETDEAVNQATSIITGNFGNVQAARSNVTFPRQIGGVPVNQKLLEAFMVSHLHPDAFKDMGVLVPDGVDPSRMSDLAHWYPNSRGDGIRLEIRNPLTGRRQPVLRKDGGVVEYNYLDITRNADKRTLEEAGKGFFGKLWEKVFD